MEVQSFWLDCSQTARGFCWKRPTLTIDSRHFSNEEFCSVETHVESSKSNILHQGNWKSQILNAPKLAWNHPKTSKNLAENYGPASSDIRSRGRSRMDLSFGTRVVNNTSLNVFSRFQRQSRGQYVYIYIYIYESICSIYNIDIYYVCVCYIYACIYTYIFGI